MRGINGRLAKLEKASQSRGVVPVLKFAEDTPDSAIARWMEKNPGRNDPRGWASIMWLQINFVGTDPDGPRVIEGQKTD